MGDLQSMFAGPIRYGDTNTFTGFDPEQTRQKRIYFLFLNKEAPSPASHSESPKYEINEWWIADGYGVLPNRFEHRVYNSDHRAVLGDVSMI